MSELIKVTKLYKGAPELPGSHEKQSVLPWIKPRGGLIPEGIIDMFFGVSINHVWAITNLREIKLTSNSSLSTYRLEQLLTQKNFGPVPRFISIPSADINTYYSGNQHASICACGFRREPVISSHRQDNHEGFLCERNCSVIKLLRMQVDLPKSNKTSEASECENALISGSSATVL